MAEDEPTVYAVRLSSRALREAAEITGYLIDTIGEEKARLWYLELRAECGTLATLPTRNPLLPDESKKIGLPTRRFCIAARRVGRATMSTTLSRKTARMVPASPCCISATLPDDR